MKFGDQLAELVSTGLGSGRISRAPGTAGSVVFLILWVTICSFYGLNLLVKLLISLIILVFGSLACASYMKQRNASGDRVKDPQEIVIDEWLGLSMCLIAISGLAPFPLLLALVTFRLLDILKPGPVAWAERLPGFWGVMADDLVAGVIGLGILLGADYLFDGLVL